LITYYHVYVDTVLHLQRLTKLIIGYSG
jgi:hypothetical protein